MHTIAKLLVIIAALFGTYVIAGMYVFHNNQVGLYGSLLGMLCCCAWMMSGGKKGRR